MSEQRGGFGGRGRGRGCGRGRGRGRRYSGIKVPQSLDMTEVVFANASDTPHHLFENSNVISYSSMNVNNNDTTGMLTESTAATTTSGSTSLTGSDGMMIANAVIVLMLVLWHIRH